MYEPNIRYIMIPYHISNKDGTMQQILDTIQKASTQFMFGHVTLDYGKMAQFKIDTSEADGYFARPAYLNTLYETLDKELAYKLIHIFNAINASLQYSFFNANAAMRFDGIDSQWVIEMLDDVFADIGVRSVTDVYRTKGLIVENLMASNITMLRSRIETVEEVFERLNFYEYGACYADIESSIGMLKRLICFKQDLFFKKGLFAVMMTGRMVVELKTLHREFAHTLVKLPVPADYQIPKMLRHYGLIVFSPELSQLIESSTFLPNGCEMELNIRAATVLACGEVAKVNGVSADDVDGYLFSKRKESGLKHHLCMTEGY